MGPPGLPGKCIAIISSRLINFNKSYNYPYIGPPGYPGSKGDKGDRGDAVSIILQTCMNYRKPTRLIII